MGTIIESSCASVKSGAIIERMKSRDEKPINAMPTEYSGIQMKSRFEAQCAFLLDRLGWKWEYESKSYMLPNGTPYLPDFWVPGRGLFIECRGYSTVKGEEQSLWFAELLAQGIEHKDWGSVGDFLVLRGDSEAKFYSRGKSTGMALLIHCTECGWMIPPPSNVTAYEMNVPEAFCPSCIAPMGSPHWWKWDGKAAINAAAIVTTSQGKLLVNGVGSECWGWLEETRVKGKK